MFRRFFFFILTNIMIMLLISTLVQLFGIQPYLTQSGIDYQQLIAICLVWGMGGAFISLLLSKWSAKMMMGLQPIDITDPRHGWIADRVHEYARKAGITTVPEVYFYESPELNAFATGPSKNNSLVAVSTGLIQQMNKAEVEGVLGHEVAHIANGDMVTMTLIQGVINAFVMFLARVVTFAIDNLMKKDDDEGLGGLAQYLLIQLFQVIFGILGSLVTCYFSRTREYKADEGGASLAGKDKMIAGLQALKAHYEIPADNSQPALATFKISGGPSWLSLFSTHPQLDDRINALKSK
jgi:heat shock protein HtpX